MRNEVTPDLLEKAADFILEVGLHQKDFWPGSAEDRNYTQGQPVCGWGALQICAGKTEHWQTLDTSVTAVGYLRDLVETNDRDGATPDDVATYLRHAAKLMREDLELG